METSLLTIWPKRAALRMGWMLVLLCMSFSTPAAAKSLAFKKGMQSYTKGEFDKAVKYLQMALKKKPGKADAVKIHKVMGMSLFTLGKQSEAEKAFERCLILDSSCSIDKNEALDEAVLPFFQNIRRRVVDPKGSAKSSTRILVKTSPREAEILRDGILLGPAHTAFDASPGIMEIEVRAKGYRSRIVKIAVNSAVENVYEVKLEKLSRDDERDDGESRHKGRDKGPPVLPEEDELARESGSGSRKKKNADDALFEDFKSAKEVAPLSAADRPPSNKAAPREPISLAHFLPLGIGQYANGDFLMGTFFLGSQVTAAIIAIGASQDIRQADANKVAAARRAQADPNVTQEEVNAFVLSNRRFVDERQQRLNFAIAAGAGLYGFGVLHAILTRPTVAPGHVQLELKPSAESQGLALGMRLDF